MYQVAANLKDCMAFALDKLSEISEQDSSLRPGPERWTKKEVIGHLIDSAVNNHQRFIRAQLLEELDFPGYEQERWVAVQKYNDLPWEELLLLWDSMNGHISRVIAFIPSEQADAQIRISGQEPVSLEFLISDYLSHLIHHLHKILPDVDFSRFDSRAPVS